MTDQSQQTTRSDNLWDLLHKESYTPQEASQVLNIGERVILSAAFGGDLKATIIKGDVVSVSRTDLVAWLKWRESR